MVQKDILGIFAVSLVIFESIIIKTSTDTSEKVSVDVFGKNYLY